MQGDNTTKQRQQSFQQQQQQQYYEQQDATRPGLHTLSDLTPYLGLRARLSQVWINRWTILLLLVLARTLIAISGLHHDLDTAKAKALSACSGVEQVGSAMASMPHYLAAGVNDMTASGVEKAVNGLMSMILLTVTGVEEIAVFYVNMLTSTYTCLITLAIRGSLEVGTEVLEDVADFMNKTLSGIANDIANEAGAFDADLNKFISALNSIPQIFGKDGDIPTLNINDSLAQLRNTGLPPTVNADLAKLNSSLPTFTQVQNFTDNIVRFPFEEVKSLINNHISNFSLDRSLFPVPQTEKLTFCSDNSSINDFFGDLYHIAHLAQKIFVAVLVIAAILACVPMAYRDIRGWRTQQKRALLINQRAEDPMDVIYIASRPYTSSAGLKAASHVSQPKNKILTRWFVAYVTSVPALFILSLALAGLFSCLCQYVLLRSIQKEVPKIANEVGDFTAQVISTLMNASAAWANGTNDIILKTSNDINDDVFGWVNITTHAINDTLNGFVDEMSKALNETFGGTPLLGPIQDVLNCLIGLKIEGVQKGLTWVSDNAHIDFPLLPNNTFSLGAAASLDSNGTNATSSSGPQSFLASPGSVTSDEITSAITDVTDFLESGIRTEALISLFILLLWFFLVLIGLARTCFVGCIRRNKNRGEGGPTYAGDIPLDTTFVDRCKPVFATSEEPFQNSARGPPPPIPSTAPRFQQAEPQTFMRQERPVSEIDDQVPAYEPPRKGFFMNQSTTPSPPATSNVANPNNPYAATVLSDNSERDPRNPFADFHIPPTNNNRFATQEHTRTVSNASGTTLGHYPSSLYESDQDVKGKLDHHNSNSNGGGDREEFGFAGERGPRREVSGKDGAHLRQSSYPEIGEAYGTEKGGRF
ncbi:plasma membrane fusion protein prm1 [Agyrium rufum]|nr:plasma membrane fusion protein prm1 [Agyrium rufum]